LAEIEASVDYPEDVGGHEGRWMKKLSDFSSDVNNILKFARQGEVMRSGISIAIVGPPNSGKSSLLNTLLSQNRAIVSDTPGTTRDILIETISVRGIPCEIIDTAGIRSQATKIEAEGIRRSHQALEGADIVLVVLDATSGISFYINEYSMYIGLKPALFLINKSDLIAARMDSIIDELPPSGILISVKENKGLDKVGDSIYEIITGSSIELGGAYFINERQKDSLSLAHSSLVSAHEKMALSQPVEVAIDIRLSIQSLDDINGAVLADDIIGRVFSRFCVGK
jgi:tRNA modification GTPase